MLKIVLDANIYLAAMGSRSFCYDLIDRLSEQPQQYPLFISEAIIKEVEKNAEKLLKLAAITSFQKRKVAEFVQTVPNLVFPEEKINFLKDNPKDNKILECAAAVQADLIVTMDNYLLKLKRFRTSGIIHPKMFFYLLPNS